MAGTAIPFRRGGRDAKKSPAGEGGADGPDGAGNGDTSSPVDGATQAPAIRLQPGPWKNPHYSGRGKPVVPSAPLGDETI